MPPLCVVSSVSSPPPAPAAQSATVSSRPHWAARFEDLTYRALGALLARRGWTVRVEPYTGYGNGTWVRVLARTVLARHTPPGVTPDGDPTTLSPREERAGSRRRGRRLRGWRSFLSVQRAGAEITAEIGGRSYRLTSDRGGYIDIVLPCRLSPGWHDVRLIAPGRAPVNAPTLVVDPAARVGIVSDVDDTVMVTALPRPLIAAWNSFVLYEHARRPVAGMSELYRRFLERNPGAPVLYLSTGAWNVAPALRRFLLRHRYPVGPLLLTDWGPTNTGWFRSGLQHKHDALRRLAAEFPDVRWLLVGDDGQHDPALYRGMAAESPDHVLAVAIRQLTPAEQVLAHGSLSPVPDHEPDRAGRMPPVVAAPDGYGLADGLTAVKVL